MSLHHKLFVGVAALAASWGLGCQSTPAPQARSTGSTPVYQQTAGAQPARSSASDAQLARDRANGAVITAPTAVAAAPVSDDGWIRGRLAYPTGDPATSALLLEKSLPAEVTAGKPFDYELKVTNTSKLKLEGVEVAETIPPNIKLAEMTGATVRDGSARYAFGHLMPGESKTIRINATPTGTGAISSCSSVAYNTTLCLATNIVSPALKLAMTAPPELLVCETLPIKLVVTNSGTGAARNVKIEAPLPAGMTTADGKNVFGFDAGTLAAGQSKEISFNAKVAKPGKYDTKASARADDGLMADATAISAIARTPILAVTTTGPERQYIGRPITYEITVKNTGDAPARETVLVSAIPADAEFSAASDSGRNASGKVQWAIGELAPGASKKVSVTLSAAQAASLRNQVTAQARCAENVSAMAVTELSGIPALLLECVDLVDPIEVGQNQTYVIRVTNQGSAPATNVKLVCNLEDTMGYVSSSGATRGGADGRTITFEPVATIPPKGKAEWQVVVKAVNSGDVRFKIDMKADQLSRPVEETESSNFYK